LAKGEKIPNYQGNKKQRKTQHNCRLRKIDMVPAKFFWY